jgi:hypothetical protein
MSHFWWISLPLVCSLLNFIVQLLQGTSGATQGHVAWAIIVIAAHLGLIVVLPSHCAQLRNEALLCKL